MSLHALLDDSARFDCEYRDGLSNHLPMALLSLRRLGADDARLMAYAALYARRLEAAPAAARPAGGDWTARLGERDAWASYRRHFADALAADGRDAVLAATVPRLMSGCAAAAFHGLIRTACAVQAGHPAELADALAYWACRHLPLDGGAAPSGRRGLIFEAMQQVAAEPAFDAAVQALPIDGATLERLARSAAVLYSRSGNFTVLHLVTSAHAMRTLLPFAGKPLHAVAHYARAWLAGHSAAGAAADAPAEPLPWSRLVAQALVDDDEHLIKLVDSCREEERAYGGDDWQRAASRIVRSRLR